MPFAYILKCADGSFYVGKTNDLRVRLDEHQSGVGANFTALRRKGAKVPKPKSAKKR